MTSKIIFNINWGKDPEGIRRVELEDFASTNSNIIGTAGGGVAFILSPTSPDHIRNFDTVDLFLVKKRSIRLMDIWNRILNSGLFKTIPHYITLYSGIYPFKQVKIIGSNMKNMVTEYPFRQNVADANYGLTLKFDAPSIFNRLIIFIMATIKHYKSNELNNDATLVNWDISKNGAMVFKDYINLNFKANNPFFTILMDELIEFLKTLIDETKLLNELNMTFNDLYYSTADGRDNLLKLDNYKLKYAALAKHKMIPNNLMVPDKTTLYPNFGQTLIRNTESENWAIKNVIIDTSSFDNQQYQTQNKLLCSQLKMDRPITTTTKEFIDWTDPDDEPYIMVYNGGTYIHLPDENKFVFDRQEGILEHPDYIFVANKMDPLPFYPLGVQSIEFTFKTTDTVYPNYIRKLFGPISNNATYTYGLGIASDLDGNNIRFRAPVNCAQAEIFTDGYKNKTAKIKLVNPITGGSELYIDDILMSTGTVPYIFDEQWVYGSTDKNRNSIGSSISNLKIDYNYLPITSQPDNQMNLAAKFWKIGTADKNDPKYNNQDDIKLKMDHPLSELYMLDYFDNLTLYLKLDKK